MKVKTSIERNEREGDWAMRKWRVETMALETLEARLNEIEGLNGKIQQILANSHRPNICRVIWCTEPKQG